MRISSKIISIGSLVLAIILLVSTGIGLFVAFNKDKTVQTESINYKQEYFNFFKSNKNNNNTIHQNLSKQINKLDVLYYLTFFTKNFDYQNINYDDNAINNNILIFLKRTISKIKQFQNIDEYYIMCKYQVHSNVLLLDIRWAKRSDILNNQKTSLFYEQMKITIL